jgi:hypothetical protein
VALKIGIGRVLIQLLPVINFDEMKYPVQTVNHPGGEAESDITTSLVTKPYTIEAYDPSNNYIGAQIGIRIALVGGAYHIYIYCVTPLILEIYITY